MKIKGQPTASATEWAGKEKWTLVTVSMILAGRCPFSLISGRVDLHDPVPFPLCPPFLPLSSLLTLLQPHEPPRAVPPACQTQSYPRAFAQTVPSGGMLFLHIFP